MVAKKTCCAVACCIVSMLLMTGCGPNNNGPTATAGQTQSPGTTAGQGWGSQLAALCDGIPFPVSGVLGDASLDAAGSVTTGTAAINKIKLYDYVQWMGALEEDGWYLFGNEANKGASHIKMTYSTRDEVLHAEVTSDSSRGEWPQPVTAELDYMIPVYSHSTLMSAEELQMENYDQAVRMTFKNAPEQDVQAYLLELEAAGYDNLGQASGLHVLEKGIYEVNVYLDLDGVKPVEITLLKHTVQMVPLPPWPDELPTEFAAVLPRMGSPVVSVEPAVIGYKIDVNDVSGYEVYIWYTALPGQGWGAVDADGSSMHTGAGFMLGNVYFDSPSMTFGFTVEPQDSERTAAVTAKPLQTTNTQTQGNGNGDAAVTPGNNTSGHNTGDVTYSYRLTSGKYEADDAEFAVKKEFGANASVADWNNLKREYAGKADSFLTGLGVNHNEDVWVNRNYTGYYEGARRYFLAKVDGVKRDDFLIHDRWDGDTVWLGSWSGMQLRVIALVPSQ